MVQSAITHTVSPSLHNPDTAHRGKPAFLEVDFNVSPFLVIWEVTRACDLACVHCRAEAQPRRHPLELTREEGFRLLDQVRAFGRPLCVLTGGDPMKRPEVLDFVRYGDGLGLRMALTPSGTGLMTREVVRALKKAGLSRLAISLDGSTAEVHDAFRQVRGSYGWTMACIAHAHAAGLPVQINTTITRHNLADFDGLVRKMIDLKIVLWSVFFLVPTGRGQEKDEVTSAEYEWVFHRLYDLSKSAPFDIKTTAAPHYRRVVLQRMKAERRQGQGRSSGLTMGPGFHAGRDQIGRAAKGVNDGDGFVFISHTGDIYPSGFLPVSGGNVRRESLVETYRNSPLFRTLRDRSQLKGKCGLCEYKNVCGGSRARAYALTGDYLESDPYCAHVPKGAEHLAHIIR